MITVRGGNGSGKSTLLASLKTEMKKHAYYWPTTDRRHLSSLSRRDRQKDVTDQEGDDEDTKEEMKPAT